jgi:hypothetical protein
MKTETPTFTAEQLAIVQQYVALHGLSPEQISFDGTDLTPSFDHNAISVLSLKLTDISDISPTRILDEGNTITVFGKTLLPDGRSRGSIGSCAIGEILANKQKVENTQVALGVATSRCFRQGIRNVGVNLHAAHLRYIATGQIADSHLRSDPRKPVYAEIHILATEIDLIVDGDKTKYQQYLAENYAGRLTAADLDDVELHRLLIQFRSLARLQRSTRAA